MVLDDYRTISIDGKAERHAQDKGHVEQLRFLARQLAAASSVQPTLDYLATTAATLEALGSLHTGTFIAPRQEI